ncbi:ArsR family transcriptional regulator [Bacillus anthracis]|nr:ArsR family transcriptional regulator [Bacillus anthracis]
MSQNQFECRISEEDVEILKIMAHPMRLQLVMELKQRETCNVTQLTEILNIPQSTVSQHLSKIKQNKVVRAERRGLEMYYQIHNDKVSEVGKTLLSENMKIMEKR